MCNSEFKEYEKRLKRLENTNRSMKILLILVGFLLLFLVMTGFSKNGNEIAVNKITLLHKGQPWFSIRAGKHYHEGDSLIISNAANTERVKILLNGPETKLSLFDGVHDIAGLDLFSAQTYCGLHISDRDWNVGKFWVKNGEPTIELFSDKGRPHFKVPK